jgi:cytoskeletal protein RodZ
MTQTIGQRLKAEREDQRLTLEKVFEATRIRVQYLQALEADDLSVMPSPVQARGYLRNYAEFLGFDVGQVLEELREVNGQPSSEEVIGPVDISSPPVTEIDNVDLQPAPSMAEPMDVVSDKPPLMEELTVPIKPESVRRKKNDSEPVSATVEPPTRRRSRKKDELDVIPLPEEPLEEGETAAATALHPLAEPEREAGMALEPSAPVETTPGEGGDEAPLADVSDSLWQSWLNRVGSMLSARGRRRTLTPNVSSLPESEPVFAATEIPIAREELGDSPEAYKLILKEIGKELRQRRELLSLHFDEVERNTHVKAHYLEALERGALDELPSTVQTRGMLSNYATFLDLDVDALLLRFADALQARHRERNPQRPARKPGQPILTNMPPMRSFIAGDMIFGVGMAVLLVGFAIWGVNRVMTVQSQQELEPTSPSISDVLLSYPNQSSLPATATFVSIVDSFPGEATVTVEIPTQNVNADVQLNLVAVERAYMRVLVDGEVAFDGRVVPGNAYPFEAENQIEVLVGSGAAIRIVYNGRDLGLMGTFGQVVNNIYLASEVITPTGMPTSTPTVTPTPTRTAPATASLQSTDTATVAPSATPVP